VRGKKNIKDTNTLRIHRRHADPGSQSSQIDRRPYRRSYKLLFLYLLVAATLIPLFQSNTDPDLRPKDLLHYSSPSYKVSSKAELKVSIAYEIATCGRSINSRRNRGESDPATVTCDCGVNTEYYCDESRTSTTCWGGDIKSHRDRGATQHLRNSDPAPAKCGEGDLKINNDPTPAICGEGESELKGEKTKAKDLCSCGASIVPHRSEEGGEYCGRSEAKRRTLREGKHQQNSYGGRKENRELNTSKSGELATPKRRNLSSVEHRHTTKNPQTNRKTESRQEEAIDVKNLREKKGAARSPREETTTGNQGKKQQANWKKRRKLGPSRDQEKPSPKYMHEEHHRQNTPVSRKQKQKRQLSTSKRGKGFTAKRRRPHAEEHRHRQQEDRKAGSQREAAPVDRRAESQRKEASNARSLKEVASAGEETSAWNLLKDISTARSPSEDATTAKSRREEKSAKPRSLSEDATTEG
jgi:hypothetical protein